jgi:hypothetical protein
VQLADSIGISSRIMLKVALDMADQIEKALPNVVEELLSLALKGSGKLTLLEHAPESIHDNIKKIKARCPDPTCCAGSAE